MGRPQFQFTNHSALRNGTWRITSYQKAWDVGRLSGLRDLECFPKGQTAVPLDRKLMPWTNCPTKVPKNSSSRVRIVAEPFYLIGCLCIKEVVVQATSTSQAGLVLEPKDLPQAEIWSHIQGETSEVALGNSGLHQYQLDQKQWFVIFVGENLGLLQFLSMSHSVWRNGKLKTIICLNTWGVHCHQNLIYYQVCQGI